MKFHLMLILLVFHCSLFAQAKGNKPAHVISFESGMYNRGLAGISYQRLFIQQERFMVSAGGGLGIGGVPFGGGINQFYYATISTGIGLKHQKTQFYISPGVDFKYLNYFDGEYNQQVDDYVSTHYEGFGVMPNIGLTIIEKNLFIQMRAAPLFLMNRFKIAEIYPGVGLTVGIKIP